MPRIAGLLNVNRFYTRCVASRLFEFYESLHMPLIRVILPYHLTVLAHCEREIALDVATPITIRTILDSLESRYAMLRGTVRDHGTLKRRPLVRFYACEEDLSHGSMESPLPEPIASGKEPFIILGAIAGG